MSKPLLPPITPSKLAPHTATCRCVPCLDKRLPGVKPGDTVPTGAKLHRSPTTGGSPGLFVPPTGCVSVARSVKPPPKVDYEEEEKHFDFCIFYNERCRKRFVNHKEYDCICEEIDLEDELPDTDQEDEEFESDC